MKLETIRDHARSGTRWTSLATVYITIADIVTLMLLARLLDKSAFGLLAILLVVIGFCSVFLDFGISVAVIHRQEVSRDEYCTLFGLNMLAGIGFYGLLWLLAWPLAKLYHEPQLAQMLPLIGLNLIFAAGGLLHKTVLQKELQFGTIALVEMCGKTIYMAVAVVLAWRGWGVYALIWGSLAFFLANNGLFWLVGQRQLPLRPHFHWSEARPFLRIGVFQTGTAVTNYLVSNLDVLLIGYFFPLSALGGYSLAKQLAIKPFMVITQVFSRLVGPLLAQLQRKREEMQTAYVEFLAILSFMAIPVFVLSAYWGRELMMVFYGAAYQEYGGIFQLLCLYMIFVVYGNPVGGLIMATGRTGLGMSWELGSSAVRVVGIALGCLISLEGVVWCQLATAALLFVLCYRILVYNLCGLDWRRFIAPALPALAVAVLAGVVTLVLRQLPGPVVIRTVLGLASGLGLYWMIFRFIFRAYYKNCIGPWLTLSRSAPAAAQTE